MISTGEASAPPRDESLPITEQPHLETTYRQQWVDSLSRRLRKVWTGAYIMALSFNMFGMFILLRSTITKKKDGDEGNEGDNNGSTNNGNESRTSGPDPPWKSWLRTFRKLFDPGSFWLPLLATSTIVYYILRGIQSQFTTYGDVESFRTACPESGRRTQTGVLVKLFAAIVTTIGVHGHLGSLSGSNSWRREFLRATEVVMSPLANLFLFASMIHIGIVRRTQVWRERTGLRHWIAQICYCKVSSSTVHAEMFMAAMSPVHWKMTPMSRSLKWYGRITLLIVLVGQYIQAFVLLARRLRVGGFGTVDIGMLFLVISGVLALFQSLAITLINVEWRMREPFTPCTEKPCKLPECVALKQNMNLPSANFQFVLFGIRLSGAPRTILHLIAGGNLQMQIITIFAHEQQTLAKFLSSTIAVKLIWDLVLSFIINVDAGRIFVHNLMKPERAEENTDSTTSTSNQTQKSEEPEPWTFVGALGTVLFHLVMFLVGVGAIVAGLVGILMHIVYLAAPFIVVYWTTLYETSTWKNCDPSKPCPQLWKDDLEDMLWWF